MVIHHQLGWEPAFIQRSPWFWPLAAAASPFERHADWPGRAELDAAYRALAGDAEPLCFAENVRKQALCDEHGIVLDRLYDGRITRRGEVPTRERDWHDFFNALCFMTFPRAKRALHRRQFALQAARIPAGSTRLPSTRTPEQDALTLFDEGGAVIAAEGAAFQQLMAADDGNRLEVLAELLAASTARVIPFGHALFEHLVEGLRCPGGSTRILELASVALPDRALIAEIDRRLAESLADPRQFREPRESAHVRLADLGLR